MCFFSQELKFVLTRNLVWTFTFSQIVYKWRISVQWNMFAPCRNHAHIYNYMWNVILCILLGEFSEFSPTNTKTENSSWRWSNLNPNTMSCVTPCSTLGPPPPVLAGPDVWDKENALDQQHKNLWFACLVVWKQHQTVVSWWFTMVETKNKHPKQAQATYATF